MSNPYPRTISEIVAGTFGWTSSNFRALLLTPDAAYNRSHQFVSSLVNNELAQASRVEITAIAAVDDGISQFVFGANDVIFPVQNSGQTIGAVAVYKFVTNDADSWLVSFSDAPNTATNNALVTVRFSIYNVFSISY